MAKTQKKSSAKKAKPAPEVESTALKDMYDHQYLKKLGRSISISHPQFNSKALLNLSGQFPDLEMKARVHLVRDHLAKSLPGDFLQISKILRRTTEEGKLSGFELWPFTEYVQTYGLAHPELSLNELKFYTRLFTSEFAVRPFILNHPKLTLEFLIKCSKDSDPHIRRWASEGSRSRLPWGQRLKLLVDDPSHTLPILENLKYDDELYVRKSVANHLNDISKDHPDKAVKILGEWIKGSDDKHQAKVQWITRHALRTLIKKGHPGALKLIGVSANAEVKVVDFGLKSKNLKMGDHLEFSFKTQSASKRPQKLVIDYILHFMKANNKTAPKVFKLKTVTLNAKEEISIIKKHHLKKITTRVYYPGAHAIDIQINGKVVHSAKWNLTLK